MAVCAQYHEWKARPADVKRGEWCPACAGTQKLTLESLQKVAAERGGKLLATAYVDSRSPLLWECAEDIDGKPARPRYGTDSLALRGGTRLAGEAQPDKTLRRGAESELVSHLC